MSGRLILMGSGELAPPMVPVHRAGLEAAQTDTAVIVDSPFGFQENVPQLSARIASFFETSLSATPVVASYRRAEEGTAARERFIAMVAAGRYVFSGPGSPSYALARWAETDLGETLQGLLVDGATVTLASAAAATAGQASIPVYEIYKVGADPFWLQGMDLTAPFGFSFVVVPHWNNQEGGDHDTSHCYIGERRFELLRPDLEVGVLGVDEHSAAVLDFRSGAMSVFGVGGVSIEGREKLRLQAGDTMPIEDLAALMGPSAPVEAPALPRRDVHLRAAVESGDTEALLVSLLALEEEAAGDGSRRGRLRTAITETVDLARHGMTEHRQLVGSYIDLLVEVRGAARDRGDYLTADAIRDGLVRLGVELHDTPDGTTWGLVT